MTGEQQIPPGLTAKTDQASAAADAQIDRLGAVMSKSREEGADEHLVIALTVQDLIADSGMTRSGLATYYVRAADRLHRALAELAALREEGNHHDER